MRTYMLMLAGLVALCGCGEEKGQTSSSGGTGGGVASPLTGTLKQLVIPATASMPAFKGFSLDFVGWEGWASDANMPAANGSVTVQSASSSCATSGCAFNSGRIFLGGATQGMFATAHSDAGGWVDTTSLIINPNQVQQASRLGSQITAFNAAYALPQAALDTWAQLLGLDSASLLARGVTLGFVWNSTQASGSAPAVAAANVAVQGAPDGLQLVFPNDAYTALSNKQTNSDGAFLLVGPPQPDDEAPLNVALTLSYSQSPKYVSPVAIVRPGTLTLMPILPQI